MAQRKVLPYLCAVSVLAVLTLLAEPVAAKTNVVCVGTRGYGVACLTEKGWSVQRKATGILASNHIRSMTACRGRILVLAGRAVSIFNGVTWLNPVPVRSGFARQILCEPRGGFWIGGGRSVARWHRGRWTRYRTDNISTGEATPGPKKGRAKRGPDSGYVRDIALGAAGRLWVLTSRGIIARLVNTQWMRVDFGKKDRRRLGRFPRLIGGKYGPWVAYGTGLAQWAQSKWRFIPGPGNAWAVATGKGKSVWLGYYARIVRYANRSWNRMPAPAAITGLVEDGKGRLWVATRYGLSLYKDGRWTTRRMDNSPLPSNILSVVAVLGDGVAMPPPVTQESGIISGRLTWHDGSGLAGAIVELCATAPNRWVRRGQSPCHRHPQRRVGKTDKGGRFSFGPLRPADYFLILKSAKGKGWVTSFSTRQTHLPPGISRDIGVWRLRRPQK